MDTATMRLDTQIVSASWSQSPAPASALPVLRRPSTPRRKVRPRSPDPPSNPCDQIEVLSQSFSPSQPLTATNFAHSSHSPEEKNHSAPNAADAQPGPPSSTAIQLTDDDLDVVTDVASDKDYRHSHNVTLKKNKPVEPRKDAQPSQPPQPPALPTAAQLSVLHPPPRPMLCLDSDLSSDEEEDYRQSYRTFLRLRTPEDEAQEQEILDEIRRRRIKPTKRGKREENNLKKKAVARPKFNTPEALKSIRVTASAAEANHDLLDMFGIKDEEAAEYEGMKDAESRSMKRKRSDELISGELVLSSKKRCPTPPKAPKQKVKTVVTRGKQNIVKKVASGVKSSNVTKKKTVANLNVGGSNGKMFIKHSTKKGWSVCVECGVEVWPPNCQKHLSACNGGA